MRTPLSFLAPLLTAFLILAGCDDHISSPEPETEPGPTAAAQAGQSSTARAGPGSGGPSGSFTFAPPVFDIAAGPNGNLLVPETVFPNSEVPEEGETNTSTIWEIRQDGNPRAWTEVTTVKGSPINGIEANGQADLLVTSGGVDEAVGAGLWQVTPGGQRLLGDIETFEVENDPDLLAIEDWKDPACARASGPFTPGPQSNPYHLDAAPGGTFLVGDAAGNTLLRVKRSGRVGLAALFTPPTEDGGASNDPEDWLEFPFEGAEDGSCYVQPVPNSVAIGPDRSMYVGELTGVGGPVGVSRVWRIDPGAQDVTCPSSACEVAFTGFTSIIDVALGPEGDLYVVEYDEAGWLTAVGVGTPEGGTVNRCDLGTETCEIAEIGGETLEDLLFPSAVAFDKWGDLWLLENSLTEPTVRKLE